MKYSLVIECNHNNYLPIDWQLLPNYNCERTDELIGIDSFTQNMSEECFRNVLETEFGYEADKKIVINFFEQGFPRELPYGPCFSDKKEYISREYIWKYLIDNVNNKPILNKIYNELSKLHNKTPGFEKLLFAINNLNLDNINILSNINNINYLELRSLGMFIATLNLNLNIDISNQLKVELISSNIVKKELTKEAA